MTYLAQEIRAEALVRNLESFTRFLSIAALANGQVTNVAGIARDAAISRPTVQSWFEVLTDTPLGTWLPAWRPRAKIKEIAHPKFYLFDPGVARALAGRLLEPLDSAERGPLLETLVFHELQAHVAYSGCGGDLSYYRTPSGTEIDFIWTRGRQAVGIEVKAAARWRSEDGRALADMRTSGFLTRGVGVNLGASPLKDGNIDILPLADFLSKLSAGEIIG